MRERIQLVLKFLFLVFLIAIVVFIWESLPIISGYAAKVACSGIFVAGRQPNQVLRQDLASFPANLASCTVDLQDSSVTASVLGLASRKAIYRWKLGATLVSNGVSEESLREQHIPRWAAPVVNTDTIDWPMGDRVGAMRTNGIAFDEGGKGLTDIDTVQLQAALGLAFGEGGAPVTGTRAVLIVYHGRLIFERYAPGFDRHTRLLGWSMTKGITNALIGILAGQHKLNIEEPAPVAEWAIDERRDITLANLLHMNSGLRWWEFYGGPSDATQMLFKEADMGGYAMRRLPRHAPGTVFNYSSGTANILSSIIRKAAGEDDYYHFPYQQLFEKTGMYSAVMELDANGTFVGSSYCYATARDWTRFGLLYLHDGMFNGQRVLPEGWVRWTVSGEGYGALWWLNRGPVEGRRHPELPADCFSSEGYEGQYTWVIPSRDVVIVRLAMEHGNKLSPDTFVPQVLRALR
ncbi:serine hydrolase domain-containing protein [Puia dinghuensis]|uniref:Serine hydrolase n=1 Tax=Puia dinghuensis TaxID=1792502 RepID=A0A8J2UH56_9BACT|nr:serine hydrolase [Puia dinghuensis]GGB17393.1 serine hydrolase [Puia dinghuensis]